jgi:hypothetical protein
MSFRTRQHVLSLLIAAAAAVAFAAPATARAAAPEPGVVLSDVPGAGSTVDTAFAQASALGSSWVRVFMSWRDVQPTAGGYDGGILKEWDAIVSRANNAGLKLLIVIFHSPAWASGSADPNTPPRDPQALAGFLRFLASRYAGRVAAYEVWNEEDEREFWSTGPDPARYAAMLKAAYPAVKVADASAKVIFGGMVGNHYDFLQKVYDAGAKGSFDAVGVHTDTACNLNSPDAYFREASGRISRWSFTGYREVRRTILDNGDDKPIWMTELGWSTTGAVCASGEFAGKKQGGVSEAAQASNLTAAYQCLAADDFVPVAIWFNLKDYGAADTMLNRYGLMRPNLTRKPAFDAFKAYAGGARSPKPCGGRIDRTPPVVEVLRPAKDAIFTANLPIEARASDDQELVRIQFLADGRLLRNFKTSPASLDWMGAKKLALGAHTITVKAFDGAQNVTTVNVPVRKVDPAGLGPYKTRTSATAKLSGRRVAVTVRVASASATAVAMTIPGKVRLEFAKRRGSRWVTAHKYDRNASKPFTLTRALAPARWRITARYAGAKPFKGSSAPAVLLTVR